MTGLAHRLQAAFGAFLAPDRLLPVANDNPGDAAPASLTDPLALPPEWHGREWNQAWNQSGDLIGLSFLPFDR